MFSEGDCVEDGNGLLLKDADASNKKEDEFAHTTQNHNSTTLR